MPIIRLLPKLLQEETEISEIINEKSDFPTNILKHLPISSIQTKECIIERMPQKHIKCSPTKRNASSRLQNNYAEEEEEVCESFFFSEV